MSMKDNNQTSSSSSLLNQDILLGALYNWTDYLPKCTQSGIGKQVNRTYHLSAGQHDEDYGDQSFHFQCPDDCYLYGIIDGHGGLKAANFTGQKLPAELLLGQLKVDYTDTEVCQKLQEAFEGVAKGFIDDLINDALVEKMDLEERIPEAMNHGEAFQRFPSLFQRIQELDAQIAGGCSVVIALIHQGKLYVANVGDSRALLCRVDEKNGELGVIQLSTDHTVSTKSELQRLANLGLDIEKIQTSGILKTTRSIGDWSVKGGYKNIDLLSIANEEPILSKPSVHGGERLNDKMQFLILMSQGVYQAYQEATGVSHEQVNNDIAYMVRDEIMKQTTIEEVSQSTIDQICRLHLDEYVKSQNQTCFKRDDMTLLVRLFNIELGAHLTLPNPTTTAKPALKTRRLPGLTPLIMPPKPPPRPPKPVFESPTCRPSKEPESPGSNPTSPQFLPQMKPIRAPSPLSVTIIENTGVSNRYPEERVLQRTDSVFPDTVESPSQELDDEFLEDCAPLYRGFTDTESKQFFQPTQHLADINAPLLIPCRRNFPSEPDPHNSNSSMLTGTSSGSTVEDKTRLFNRPAEPLETDENGRIKAYVDFTDFVNKVNEMGGEKFLFASVFNSAACNPL